MKDILTDILIYINKLFSSWSGYVLKFSISVAIELFSSISIAKNVVRLRR